MERIGEEQKMTVQEVAKALGVSEQTIRYHIRNLFPEIVKNGVATMINEKQATAIKGLIGTGRNDLENVGQVKNIVTDIEKQETIIKAFQYLKDGYEQMKARAIAAETRNQRLIHNSTTYTSGEIAKELGLKSAQELHEKLRVKGIIFKDSRGLWLLYSEYSGRGFQNIKQKEVNGAPRYYAEWTGVGRDWLVGLFAKEIIK